MMMEPSKLILRLHESARNQWNYENVDEPLIINKSEVAEYVAWFLAGCKTPNINTKQLTEAICAGRATFANKRIIVI